MMTSAQVVETSVNAITKSPSQDYPHPDDHILYDMTPGFKPFTEFLVNYCTTDPGKIDFCSMEVLKVLSVDGDLHLVLLYYDNRKKYMPFLQPNRTKTKTNSQLKG